MTVSPGSMPAFQHNILNRMDRFGITEDSLWSTYLQKLSEKEKKLSPFVRAEFEDHLSQLCHNDTLVTYTSLYAHLMDQLDWGLLSPEETLPGWKTDSEPCRVPYRCSLFLLR